MTKALTVLDPKDKISIVSYAGSTAVRLPPTPVLGSATIEAAIAGLTSSGGTNGSSGIRFHRRRHQSRAFVHRRRLQPGHYLERCAGAADHRRARERHHLWSDLDQDFQWAYAVASFAEILKGSPYATPSAVNTIGNIIGQPFNATIEERKQFQASFTKAKALLH